MITLADSLGPLAIVPLRPLVDAPDHWSLSTWTAVVTLPATSS
jgi:hypothetical protein